MISSDAKGAPPLDCGATQPVSLFSWDGDELRPKVAIDGIFSPDHANGPCRSAPPKYFEVRKPVALSDARDPDATDAKNISSKLRLNWDRRREGEKEVVGPSGRACEPA